VPAPGFDADAVLAAAAGLEKGSEHPLAAAIVSAAIDRDLPIADVTGFRAVTGKGVLGTVQGRRVALGNAALLDDEGVEIGALEDEAEVLRAEGMTVVFVAIERRTAGLIAIADPIKQSTPAALAALRDEGLRVVMLTGDNATTAHAVARQLGIDEVHAGVLPDDKGEIVARLRQEGRVVAMAGDGANDAPALARADVGIAMGTGTDVAMHSAGVTLVKGDLVGIVRSRRLSQQVMKNIRQNLFFAFVYNAVGVPVAAGIAYPLVGLLLSPMLASAAMAFSSVSVIANALRLRNARL
jgi:Cu+-exporting ATPase